MLSHADDRKCAMNSTSFNPNISGEVTDTWWMLRPEWVKWFTQTHHWFSSKRLSWVSVSSFIKHNTWRFFQQTTYLNILEILAFLNYKIRGLKQIALYIDPLQYSSLENPRDRGAWRAIVHRVTKSQVRLKQCSTHTCSYITCRNTSFSRDKLYPGNVFLTFPGRIWKI